MKNKKGRLYILIIAFFVFIKIEFFPFGFIKEIHGPNESTYRYKINASIKSKDDFVKLMRERKLKDLWLWKYEDSEGVIKWDEIKNDIEVKRLFWKTVYVLDYTPLECQKLLIKVTHDGYVYDYGNCGK